jgi:Holliday junction DNA helicase RuvA
MISYIKGLIALKTPTYLVVEAGGGIGYHINISLNTYSKIEKLEHVKLLTYLQVREDSHTLYGFAEEGERDIFVKLISVSGIGTNTARVLLSSMQPEEVRAAILGEDVSAFKKVKGVGPKTAKRIILDLKDKVLKDSGENSLTLPIQNNTVRDEALQGLVGLGFNKIMVQKILNKLLKEQPELNSVEALIKAALKQFS